jgi:hypothetical protein
LIAFHRQMSAPPVACDCDALSEAFNPYPMLKEAPEHAPWKT